MEKNWWVVWDHTKRERGLLFTYSWAMLVLWIRAPSSTIYVPCRGEKSLRRVLSRMNWNRRSYVCSSVVRWSDMRICHRWHCHHHWQDWTHWPAKSLLWDQSTNKENSCISGNKLCVRYICQKVRDNGCQKNVSRWTVQWTISTSTLWTTQLNLVHS